jgi:hypothetical protein
MSESDIRVRLERLVDRWRKATASERIVLVHEKMRLEEMLDDLRRAV